MRAVGLKIFAAAVLASFALTASGAELVEPLAWDSVLKEFQVKQGELQLATFFAVTNISQAEVVITQVLTSCGCTVASLPSQPWHIAPDTGGRINATLNLQGKFGTIIKTLTVISSTGNKVLTIKADVPLPAPQDPEMAARIRNQEAAKVDRLAVFKNGCAQCHLEPAFGKMRREVYADVCGVCHEAEHRATMVPDLRTVNKDNDPEIWRAFIRHGKVASLMPPFDQAEGGPLTDNQIGSLVAYLTGDFQKEARAVAQQPTPLTVAKPAPLPPAPPFPPVLPAAPSRMPAPPLTPPPVPGKPPIPGGDSQ